MTLVADSPTPGFGLEDRYSRFMTGDAQALLRKALALPDRERADLAAELIASLDEADVDDPATARDLWASELEARARRAIVGPTDGEDWVTLRQRVDDDLARG